VATDDVPSGPPPAYRSGFESLTEETTATLSVEGSIPGWLDGTLVRNGPGLFEVGERSVEHWFDGLAMLRRFEFLEEGVSYANRFLRTDAWRAAREGDFGANGFAETPDRGPLGRLVGALSLDPTDNANADVARVAGRCVALTESPKAVSFDPTSLETLDTVEWADDLPVGHTTPHFERDPSGDGVFGYLTSFLPESAYHVFRIPEDDPPRRERIATVGVENPAYMHSFALTGDHVVLTEMPFVLPPRRLLSLRDEPLLRRYEWRPQQMTRFVVLDRTSGEVVAEHRVPPFVVFHHVNAHRDGDELVVDLVAFDSPSVLNGMYLDRLRDTAPTSGSGGELRRYRLPLEGGDPTSDPVATDLALPRIRPDRTGRPYRHVYAQDSRAAGPPRGIARVDVETGGRRTWWSDGGFPGEPVVVPAPEGDAPEDGVLLVETLVPDRDRSELVVLEAGSMTERARVVAPHRIPFGFHGQYVSGEDGRDRDKHNH
jgi:carotenoid cleavage dioxygenase-like enzyme